MAVGNPKSIPSHAEWKKMRDDAGGKSNLVSKVNVGKELDKFHKLRSAKDRREGLERLLTVFVTYGSHKSVKEIKDLDATCNKISQVIKMEQVAMKQNADAGLAVGLKLVDGAKRIAAIQAALKKGDVDEAGYLYEKFWDGIGRGVGQQVSGKLKTNWNKVHANCPDRSKIGNAKEPKDKAGLIVEGITKYKKALATLQDDAKAEGLTAKVG